MNPVSASPSLWDQINSGISGFTSTMSSVYSARTQLQNLKNAQAAGQPQQLVSIQAQPTYAPAPTYSAATVVAIPPKNKTMLYVGIGAAMLLVGALLMRRK